MKSLRILVFTSLLLLGLPGSALPNILFADDGWSMNGGSDASEADNIWFSDTVGQPPEAVNYCVETGAGFTVSAAEGERLVEKALAEWREFFKTYKLDREVFGYDGDRVKLVLGDGKMRQLPSVFRKVSCSNLDLKGTGKALMILLGADHPLLEQVKAGTPEQEYAAAMRSGFDQKTFGANGLIWVGREAKTEARVYHLLLHELGHVFGMKHDSVFVMDADIGEDIKNMDLTEDYFGRIESPAWPYAMGVGVPVVISGDEGHGRFDGPAREDRVSRLCADDETLIASLPVSIRRYFKRVLPGGSAPCVKISIELLESRPAQYSIRLHLKHASHEVSVDGDFAKDRKNIFNDSGPGLYAKWTNVLADPNGGRWLRVPLSKELQALPARGTFKAPRASIQFPARIQKDRGFSVEMYDEGADKWFVLRNPFN